MARIQFGAVITDSRGKISGHQIKGTRYGAIIMLKGNPSNKRSTSQQEQRATIGNLSRQWITELTDSERTDWNILATTQNHIDTWGNTYPLTGNVLFTKLNVKRQAAALSPLTTAPADQTVTNPVTATAVISAGPTLELDYTTAPAPANHRVRIYAAAPQSPGTTTAQGRYSLLMVTAASPSAPIDITAEYEARFGAITAEKKIFLQMSFWKSTNAAESPRLETNVLT